MRRGFQENPGRKNVRLVPSPHTPVSSVSSQNDSGHRCASGAAPGASTLPYLPDERLTVNHPKCAALTLSSFALAFLRDCWPVSFKFL